MRRCMPHPQGSVLFELFEYCLLTCWFCAPSVHVCVPYASSNECCMDGLMGGWMDECRNE